MKQEELPKAYLVGFTAGGWDDHYAVNLFITANKELADKYVEKFNTLLKKWQEHYKWVEEERPSGWSWIKEELSEWFERWHGLREINGAFYEEIEVR